MFRLSRGDAFGMVFFSGGESVLSAYSEGWGEVPVDQSWTRLVSDVPVRASVEDRNVQPLNEWFRRSFHDLGFEARLVAPKESSEEDRESRKDGSTSSRIRHLFSSRSRPIQTSKLALRLVPDAASRVQASATYEQAPSFRSLRWTIEELPGFLAEREKTAQWKYLGEWIPLVRNVRLHHDLPRPDSRESDTSTWSPLTRTARSCISGSGWHWPRRWFSAVSSTW